MANASSTKRSELVMPGNLKSILPWFVSALILLFLPALFQTDAALTIMNQMAITIVFALSYNMLLGQGGMLSFGHAVYMGLGGFFCMHLMNYVEYDGLWLPLPLLPFFGGLFGLGFAIIIGAFSTRRAGTTFAMISLGVGELIAACSIIIVVFFGGEEGISGDRTIGPILAGLEYISQLEVYYLTSVWLIIATAAMYLFTRTPIGRMANAVRDNEERAEFVGYSQRMVRLISFCAAGFFAGVAGGLFAINYEILTEENLNLTTSGIILLVTFLGGIGIFIGPIIGAIVFTLLQSVLSLFTEIWQLYLGLLFVATVMYFPAGLSGLIAMHILPYQRGKLGLLTLPYLKIGAAGILTVLGAAGFLEIMFHAKHAAIGDHEMSLFWININSHNVGPWFIAAATALAGGYFAKKWWPEVKEAWDNANIIDSRGAR